MNVYPFVTLCFSYIAELAIFIFFSYNTLERKCSSCKTIIFSSTGYLFMFFFSLYDSVLVNFVFFIFVNFFLFKYLYFITLRTTFFYTFVLTITMVLTELIPLLIMRRFTYDYYNESFTFQNRLIYSIISKSLYFIIVYFLIFPLRKKHLKSIQNTKIPAIYFIISILSLAIIVPLMVLWSQDYSYIRDFPIKVLVPVITILIVVLNALVFFDEYHRKRAHQKITEMKLLIQRENDMKQYYQQMLHTSEERAILIHDIKKHLLAIQAMNSSNKSMEISDYIQNILNMPILEKKRIHSDNDFLNMVLDGYSDRCKNEDISFNTDVRSHSIDFLSTDDITTLFCNLLDNALEAASKVDNGFIDLSIDRHTDTPLSVINVRNSCKESPISMDGSLIQTTKSDRTYHGYGMKSIKKVIDKYDGIINYSYEDHTFSLSIVLKDNSAS